MSSRTWHVVQPGARMHYAVPSSFEKRNRLTLLHTDLSVPDWLPRNVARISKKHGKALERFVVASIAPERVKAHTLAGLKFRMRNRRHGVGTKYYDACVQLTKSISSGVFPTASTESVYAFDTAALEVFENWKSSTGLKILEQCVAPRAAQRAVYHATNNGHASKNFERMLDLFERRERIEWELADCIIAPSEFVRNALAEQGVAIEKIRLVPYGVDPPPGHVVASAVEARSKSARNEIRIFFAGALSLRKGINEINRLSRHPMLKNCRFAVAGRHTIESSKIKWPANVTILGPIAKSEMSREYAAADIFLLPSYLEGSATVTYEAMGWGLPIVTTPNSGSVIRDGVDGYLCGPGDVEAMAERLHALANCESLRNSMGVSARQQIVRAFSADSYGDRLNEAIDSLSSTPHSLTGKP
ncbi:glycosyltransferase family 4 protein [Rhodopirellula sp. JC740]|uniref:Glycosyltransferase family 4 protein n=1 Tax=Rhodopirellula halodulae TaxID=2894198 RepID=A0ABS8NBC8_9BACT|nr:glycosyltransferase family 4 protein [Rhodopirellula sp. JC740]MCC9640872.1 glycosyltransferase family 4 protein [Rhodopirellula sp. JC740]